MLQTIVGKRGKGKTSLTAELISATKRDQVFIFDYLGEFSAFKNLNRFTVVNTGFQNFCEDLWKNSRAWINSLVVLDEISLYGKFNFAITHMYRLGRHKSLDIIATSQRFMSLPVITRSQTDLFSMFNISEPADLEYLSKKVSPEILALIQRLEPFEYINISL